MTQTTRIVYNDEDKLCMIIGYIVFDNFKPLALLTSHTQPIYGDFVFP